MAKAVRVRVSPSAPGICSRDDPRKRKNPHFSDEDAGFLLPGVGSSPMFVVVGHSRCPLPRLILSGLRKSAARAA